MPEGILEFVLKLFAHLLNLLKFLPISPKIAGTVSLLPPLIGAAQVSWKFIQNLSGEHKKKVLRERVLALQSFLKSLPETELTDEQTQATQDARRERDAAMGALAELAHSSVEALAAVIEPSPQRNWVRRTLLLYSPKPRAIWILHGLFYFFSLELLPMAIVAVGEAVKGTLADAAQMAPALAVLAVPVVVFWGLAADLDRSSVHSRSPLQRWLLLYAPQRRVRWVWHVLFYISLVMLNSLLGLLLGEIGSKDFLDTLFAAGIYLIIALLFRMAAVRPDRNERKLGPLSRFLLLYVPRKRWVWLLHLLFWVYFITAITLSIEMAQAVLEKKSFSWTDAEVLFYVVITTLIFWGLASDVEQARQRPPGFFRRAFLLFLPDRGPLWVLHILFYISVFSVVAGLGDIATGQQKMVSATTGEEDLIMEWMTPVYLLLVAFLSRTLAVTLAPWTATKSRWITWFWLGHLPQGWLRRLAFLPAALLFYVSAFLWPLLAFMAIDDLRTHEPWSAFAAGPSVVVVGLLSRWIACRLETKPSDQAAVSRV